MAGWELSRRPEWDMMHAAGLTAREIADRCHQNFATIHAHFQTRERYEPGIRAKHEAALAARGANRPTTQWRKKLAEVLEFQKTHDRHPHHEGDEESERRLHRWRLEQRRAYGNRLMPAPKIAFLEDLVGWNNDAHQQELDDAWRTRLVSLNEFAASNRRTPRYQNHSSEADRVLGIWPHIQHQERAEGTMMPWRLKMMDAAFLHSQATPRSTSRKSHH